MCEQQPRLATHGAFAYAPKKKIVYATKRDAPHVPMARQYHRPQLATYRFRRLIFVDESDCNIAMTRLYGWARRGIRAHDAVPKYFGRNVTILGALSYTDSWLSCQSKAQSIRPCSVSISSKFWFPYLRQATSWSWTI